MLNLVRPRYVMPAHGDHKRIHLHGQLAEAVGVRGDRIFKLENGLPLEIDERGARIGEAERSGMIFVDGVDIGDPTDVALRDRRMLSADGIFIVVATISEQDGSSVAEPEVIFRGVPFPIEAERLLGRHPRHGRGVARRARPRRRSARPTSCRRSSTTTSPSSSTTACAGGRWCCRSSSRSDAGRRARAGRGCGLRVRGVHSSRELRSSSFAITVDGRRGRVADVFPGFAPRTASGSSSGARAGPSGRARSCSPRSPRSTTSSAAAARTSSSTPTTSSSTSGASSAATTASTSGRRTRRSSSPTSPRRCCGRSTTAASRGSSSRTARRARASFARETIASARARIVHRGRLRRRTAARATPTSRSRPTTSTETYVGGVLEQSRDVSPAERDRIAAARRTLLDGRAPGRELPPHRPRRGARTARARSRSAGWSRSERGGRGRRAAGSVGHPDRRRPARAARRLSGLGPRAGSASAASGRWTTKRAPGSGVLEVDAAAVRLGDGADDRQAEAGRAAAVAVAAHEALEDLVGAAPAGTPGPSSSTVSTTSPSRGRTRRVDARARAACGARRSP